MKYSVMNEGLSQNISASLIINLQNFILTNKEFVPKELATFNGHGIFHYIFKPSLSFKYLLDNVEKELTGLPQIITVMIESRV